MKRLLIVDDTKDTRDKYAAAAQAVAERLDLELIIHTAGSVQDGLQKASGTRYDCAIVDKDMPDGTGNDFAKGIGYSMPMAGITGGTPQDFDKDYFKIRLSKSEADPILSDVVKSLLDPTHKVPETYKETSECTTQLVALDILLQGYVVLSRVAEGLPLCEPAMENAEFQATLEKSMDLEGRHTLLDMKDVEIPVSEFYKQLQTEHASLADDEDVQEDEFIKYNAPKLNEEK